MLELRPELDLTAVGAGLHRGTGGLDLRVLNVEQDGGMLLSWTDDTGNTTIGKYDPKTKNIKILYSFDRSVCVSSCSLNSEETLLAVSLSQNHNDDQRLKQISKCLTLLMEIRPVHHTKVLKAVDCRVKVQFLHTARENPSVHESHLLLLTEDGYVDFLHVPLSRQPGDRVVMLHPERLSRTTERLLEDACCFQWDHDQQRLFYIKLQDSLFLLTCVQFFPDRCCETVLQIPLKLPQNSFPGVQFVNLGFDHFHTVVEELVKVEVFTQRDGRLCVFSSQLPDDGQEMTYTLMLLHKDFSKTFRVSLGKKHETRQHPLFFTIGSYLVVHLSGCFLHCINSRQPELSCHSLFLSGDDAGSGLQSGHFTAVRSECGSSLLDWSRGRQYQVDFSSAHLLNLMRSAAPSRDPGKHGQCLPALHILLLQMGSDPVLEPQVIDWLCDHVNRIQSFDPLQEVILVSLFRTCCHPGLSLDPILPFSSLQQLQEVAPILLEVPGVVCFTETRLSATFSVPTGVVQSFWSDLQCNAERSKHLRVLPNTRYRTAAIRDDWNKLCSGATSSGSRNLSLEDARKVLTSIDSWMTHEKRSMPLIEEDDHQQRALIGLTVNKLREHLGGLVPRLGKRKIDDVAVGYVAKLLELVRHMCESVWLRYQLDPRVLDLNESGRPAESSVFHFMFRILEATLGLCLPLPPGFHSILCVLSLRVLPRHTFLQYLDHRCLQLTETFVCRLMTELDNSDDNQKLKFSVLSRLKQPLQKKVFHLWDHPISSASTSRLYVRTLLQQRRTRKGSDRCREGSSFRTDFLPLSVLTRILSDLEKPALPRLQGNIDSHFVEESALKQTTMELQRK